jgi:primosomal protein N' (replication factor Y)
MGKFPSIELAFLNEKEKRKNFWITKKLEDSIAACLDRKEQAIIYINRRGFSFFIKCRECGFVFECSNCSVSLTPHLKGFELNQPIYSLLCHYCGFSKSLPQCCPSCKEPAESLITKGVGTQQVVSILREIFPKASIERADLDTTSKKRNWQNIVKNFEQGKIDILVGTQTITKGYHFPRVTLVGVLWADLNLHLPVFNASEVTLQKLIQVAGRAGRECEKSKVIVQAMAPNTIFSYLDETRYKEFYENEMQFRTLASYPPVCRFLLLEIQNSNAATLDSEVSQILSLLNEQNSKFSLNLKILGPIKPAVYRVQKVEMRHIFVKSNSFEPIHKLFEILKSYNPKSKIFIIPTQ